MSITFVSSHMFKMAHSKVYVDCILSSPNLVIPGMFCGGSKCRGKLRIPMHAYPTTIRSSQHFHRLAPIESYLLSAPPPNL